MNIPMTSWVSNTLIRKKKEKVRQVGVVYITQFAPSPPKQEGYHLGDALPVLFKSALCRALQIAVSGNLPERAHSSN